MSHDESTPSHCRTAGYLNFIHKLPAPFIQTQAEHSLGIPSLPSPLQYQKDLHPRAFWEFPLLFLYILQAHHRSGHPAGLPTLSSELHPILAKLNADPRIVFGPHSPGGHMLTKHCHFLFNGKLKMAKLTDVLCLVNWGVEEELPAFHPLFKVLSVWGIPPATPVQKAA